MDSGTHEQTTVLVDPIHTPPDVVDDCTAIFRLAFSTPRRVAAVFISLYPHTGEMIVNAHLGGWKAGKDPELTLVITTATAAILAGDLRPSVARETLESWLRTATTLANARREDVT
jgi:hypothetical protein